VSEKSSFVIAGGFGHKPHGRAAARHSTYRYLNLKKVKAVMSTNFTYPITASQAAGKRPLPTQRQAVAASRRTPMRAKIIIAGVVAVLALLYAKGVTLMIEAADKPSSYATFLYRAD
jgi:hypothetical protein